MPTRLHRRRNGSSAGAGDAADAPVGHHRRAHPLVEADRVLVPVEHAPLEAAVAALDRQARRGARAAPGRCRGRAGAARRTGLRGTGPGCARKVEKLVKKSANPTTAAARFGDQRLGDRPGAEQMRCERLRRDLQQVGQLLELGQAADQADDGLDVARLRRADHEVAGSGSGSSRRHGRFWHRRRRLQCRA